MNKQYIKIIVAILSLNILFQVSSFSQETRTVVVKDESGNPVPAALVTIGEDAKPVLTNERGEFTIPTDVNLPVLIEAEGFESIIVRSTGLVDVELFKAPFHLGQKDEVSVPFGTMKKRQIPGAVTVLDPEELLKYDQQKNVRDLLKGRVPGLLGSNDIRGLGSPLYIVNGIPREGIDISLQEIEKITFLKDLSTMMMYGAQANNGVVLITTRRGAPLKTEYNITAESGLNFPVSYPNYLSAPDYMELFNEALVNDGLDPSYSDAEISSTRAGTNPIRYPDHDYYNSTYLRDWSNYHNIVGNVSSGSEMGQFYLNLGWTHNRGLLTAIKDGNSDIANRFNLRSSVDFEIAEWVDLAFDGAAIFNFSRGPRYSTGNDFWQLSSILRPNSFPVLIDTEQLADPDLFSGARLIEDRYALGGTSEYMTNVYGELTRNSSLNQYERLIEVNSGLDFDLGGITEGLNARAVISFDMFNMFAEGRLDQYSVWRPEFSGDAIASFTRLGRDIRQHEQTITNETYFRRYGTYGYLNYNRDFGSHKINANALTYIYRYDQEWVLQPKKSLHYGLRVNYMYQNKYITELTGVYTGSGKLYNLDNMFAFSPGVGLGWIVSEESFLNDNSLIDYLKIRGNWAINHSDENMVNYRMGRDYFSTSGTHHFDHGSLQGTGMLIYPGNPALEMEKVMNANFGFETFLLDYRIGLEGSYFYNKNYDIVTQRPTSLPEFFGILPYENYGSYEHQGIEAGLNYTATIGELELNLGANVTRFVSKLLTWDELDYEDEYRQSVGRPTDAMFGYVALGLYKDQADIDNHAAQTFGDVRPGDIKYKDLNNDGVIDERDQMMIGNSKPGMQYGFNVRLKYNAFELFALSTGQNVQNMYFNNPYYWVYGDRKYSEVVLDRWTPATAATATYPRLSSSASPNNFKNSDFWLYESNWFALHTVQMTYTLKGLDFAGLDFNRVSFFIRGNNLLTLSQIKDKLELNVGSSPQMRVFSLGLNLML